MKVYNIAKEHKIIIIDEPLGNIESYYNKVDGRKFIHVNSNVPEWKRPLVIAHQLFFATKDINTSKFLIKDYYDHDLEAKQYVLDTLCIEDRITEYGGFRGMCESFGLTDNNYIARLEQRFNKIKKGCECNG